MASIVRIKRRQSQEPAEALLLAAKRIRTESDAAEISNIQQSVFKFCGSSGVAEDYEAVAKLIEKGKQLSHRKSVKEVTKARPRLTPNPVASNSEKKYKVLGAFRNVENADIPIKVYDLVPEGELLTKEESITCNGEPLVVEKSNSEEAVQYVYDFYYSDMGTFDDTYIDQLMSVQPYFYSPGEDSDSDHGEESDDSNDENNWRNDYPDTESDEGDGDEDIVGKMTGMYIEDDDEASSDEEGFVYAKYDDDDGRVHGSAYSQYKRRVKKDLNESHSESDEPDDSPYEHDSD